jgi:hypothetical protein
MPTYCYVTPSGERHERQYRMGVAPETIRVRDDQKQWHVARRDYAAEQGHVGGGKGNWPLRCHAGGVHANEVPQHRANVAKAGLNVTVENDGSVTIPTQKEYRRYCKAFGLKHYSDFMT